MAWAAELRIDDSTTQGGEAQSPEERDAARQKLYLGARASTGAQAAEVLIHNVSSTGMLLETSIELGKGGDIDVDIPEVGTVQASIVWSSETFYGCQFERPLSRAAISAALLRSPAEWAANDPVAPPPIARSETLAPAPRNPGELSPRAKFLIITGLAALSWAVVGALVGIVALII